MNRKKTISYRRFMASLVVSACVMFLLSAPLMTQALRPRSAEQKRFQDNKTAIDARIADAFYHLGIENLHEPSNSDRAVEHLEKAVELDESNAEYHYMLAEAYMANFQYAGLVRMPFIAPKVKVQLELAVKHDPGSAVYREALMKYYVFAPAILGGSYRKAHEEADKISIIDPYLGVLAHAGVYAEEGEGEKAVSLYKKAIYSRPVAWQAYYQFGNYYLEIHEIDSAIGMFKRYAEVAPDQAESYNQLGQAYQQKRMYDEAIAAFRKALERDPSRTPLVFRIAQLYEFKGNRDLAREQYQLYLTMVPSGRAADDARAKMRQLGH